jgi:hypothetical protein
VKTAPPDPWRVIGLSIQGASHRRNKTPCQDALRWRLVPPDRLLVALADGAGSAAFAEIGADLAARTALDHLALGLNPSAAPPPQTDDAWKSLFTVAIQAARQAVFEEAGRRQVPARELATTLVLLAASPGFAAAAQIGDGAAVVAATDQPPIALTRPIVVEHLNETTFITSDTALDSTQFACAPGPWRRAAVLSDGLQLLALRLPEATPHPRFFAPLFDFLERSPDLDQAASALRAFLESPRVTDRADDDLSLLLAGCLAPPGSAPAAASAPLPPVTH